MKRAWTALGGWGAALALLAGAGLAVPAEALFPVLRAAGYWYVAATLGLTLWLWWRASGRGWVRWWGRRRGAVAGAAAAVALASGFVQAQFPPGHKILADEAMLAGTARALHFTRGAAFAQTFQQEPGGLQVSPENVLVDKRPLLFPTLVATLHDLTGYRRENSGWLNVLLTPVLLGLAFAAAARLGGWLAGYAALPLLCGLPVLAHSLRSWGFDGLNVVCLLGAFHLTLDFARRPTAWRFAALALGLVTLAHARYESVLAALVGAGAWWAAWRAQLLQRHRWLAVVVLAALPLLWTVRYNFSPAVSAPNARNAQQWGDTTLFGLHYVERNLRSLANFLTSPDPRLLGNPYVLLPCLALSLVPLLAWRRRVRAGLPGPARPIWVAAGWGATLAVLLALQLVLFSGQWDYYPVARLSLPFVVAAVLGGAAGLATLARLAPPGPWPRVALVAACALPIPLHAGKVAALNHWDNVGWSPRRARWLEAELLPRTAGGDVIVLTDEAIVNDFPGVWRMGLARAREAPELIWKMREQDLVREVFVFQYLWPDPAGGPPRQSDETAVPAELVLATVVESMDASGHLRRISRLVGYQPPPEVPAAATPEPAEDSSAASAEAPAPGGEGGAP